MDDLEQAGLALWPVDQSDMPRAVLQLLFALIVCLGLVLNVYVIYRMSRLMRGDRDQFFNGTGIYLLAMAACDITSLLLCYLQLSLTLLADQFRPEVLGVLCKASEFVTRCTYSYSMYCWLFMSGLRYLAACQPLSYSTVWRSPCTSLAAVAAISFVLNLHVLVSVVGDDVEGCVINLTPLSKLYSVADVMLSAGLPSVLILTLDLQVLCCRPRRKNSDPLLQIVFHKLDEDTEKKRVSTMRRFMLVTLAALLLCLPEGVLRSVRLLLPDPALQYYSQHIFYFVKTLYLAKFSINAFYLSSFVFDRNVLSKTSSSRHLSVSAARRLDDEPAIVPRERSRTLSCRGASPLPLLTRNSSCILLGDNAEPCRLWV